LFLKCGFEIKFSRFERRLTFYKKGKLKYWFIMEMWVCRWYVYNCDRKEGFLWNTFNV